MRRYAVYFILAALLTAASVAEADEGRIPVVTRLVHVFSDLEAKLNDAIARGDRAAIEPLVAEDFELRAGQHPGTPLPRAEWIDGVLADHAAAAAVDEMAVHDQGEVALVSFLWHRRDAKPAGPGVFIVDLWGKSDGAWRLKARYSAVARGGLPGAPPAAPFKKKY